MIANGGPIPGPGEPAAPGPPGQRLFGRLTVQNGVQDFDCRLYPRCRDHAEFTSGMVNKSLISLHNPVIRALPRDLHIMHMAFLQPGAGDPHKGTVPAHLIDCCTAGIAHRCPQPADKLMNDRCGTALVGT